MSAAPRDPRHDPTADEPTGSDPTGYAREYAAAVLRRGRVPMEPADFTPDWGDAPRKGKFFPGPDLLPLPLPLATSSEATTAPGAATTATVQAGLHPPAEVPPGRGFALPTLAGMLHDSYAVIGRRLGVQANTDLATLPSYPRANWYRGTASGGGLYPCGIYWCCGPTGPLTPGVYYYSTPHHALAPLLVGDVAGVVRAALGELPAAARTDQFLIVDVKLWQNAFKYNSFSYHAVTMDVGTTLQTWRIWARANGLRIEPALWFDEPPLNRLLGIDAEVAGVFAVVPLDWDHDGPPARDATGHQPPSPAESTWPESTWPATTWPAPAVRHRDRERSRRVLTFSAPARMRRATLGRLADRPSPADLRAAAATAVPDGPWPRLPDPPPLTMDVRTALRRRRSSFGRFEARVPLEAAALAALLAASAGTGFDVDTLGPGTRPLVKMYAFVNHVRHVPPGEYEYDPVRNALRPIRTGPPGEFLQRNYFLANYNLEQAAAVLVPTVRTAAVLQVAGDRGYHLVNATIGAVAQTCYTAASALGVGCGVALGFDNVSYVEELGLTGTDEYPLLIMLVGHERPDPADFNYELV
ncbi:nitroreductase family protein [Solwaraspora sp. WMMB335]|uniref:nitroreductase family protein n=1 Tax=Solwaraspora sp. WMMB335 TaxID=3404118 RepID=UPI003B9522FD